MLKKASALTAALCCVIAFTPECLAAEYVDFDSDINYCFYNDDYYDYEDYYSDEKMAFHITDDGAALYKYWGDQETVEIPKTVKGKKVTEICRLAFFNNDTLVEAVIPDSVWIIGEQAFSGCDNLTRINIPPAVSRIPNNTFSYCKNLREIIFSEGLYDISEEAFRGCTSLEEIKFPSTLEILRMESFKDCAKLEKIEFGCGLKTIEIDAFRDCISLKEIRLPEAMKKNRKSCFCRLHKLNRRFPAKTVRAI